jgi:hypothetical protein
MVSARVGTIGPHSRSALHSVYAYSVTCRLLYDMDSPRAANGRALCFGRIFRQDGTLVATTAQEGVIRLSFREQEKRRQKAKQESKI